MSNDFVVRRADLAKLYMGDGGAGSVKATRTFGSGASGIVFTAKTAGADGNSISVVLTNPGGTAALAVSATGDAITVALGVNAGSIVSTVNDIIAAVYQSATVSALVDAAASTTGLGAVVAATVLSLAGGTNSAELFSEIKGLTNFDFSSKDHALIECGTLSDPNATITSLKQAAITAQGSLQWDPENDNHLALLSRYTSGSTNNYRIEWEYGRIEQFTAQVKTVPGLKWAQGAVVTGDFALLLITEPVEV